MKPKFKFALAAVLALAVLAVVLFSVPPVAEAMQRVLGYVPGLGLVEQGAPLRVLAEPVTVDRDGVSLTVENGSSDSQRTILLLLVQGVRSEGATACTGGSPQLRLADGTVLPVKESIVHGRDTGYHQRLVFDALPAKAENVTLEIPCLMLHVAGKTPENWQIPLVFEAAPDLEVVPVIELPPAPADEAASEPLAQPEQLAESPYGIALAVEKMVALDDGYILMGNISWTDETLGDYSVSLFDPQIVDAQGNMVPFEFVSPDIVPDTGSKRSNWAMKIEGKEQHWPITIQSDADVTLSLTDRPSFTLDLSNPPAEGQSKELNIELNAGGHAIKVLSYTPGKDPDGNSTLTFKVLGDREVMSVMFFDTVYPVLGGGGGGGGGAPTEPVPFETSFTYNGALPSGQTQIAVTAVMLKIDGNWEVHWQP